MDDKLCKQIAVGLCSRLGDLVSLASNSLWLYLSLAFI